MTNFLLIRHGEADYTKPLEWKTKGWGADLAPLSDKGVVQITTLSKELKNFSPQILLSSPTTRALEGAALLQSDLEVKLQVEFDLHEWVPDKTFLWSTLDDVLKIQADLEKHDGEWPDGEERVWEQFSEIRLRVHAVLAKYLSYERVVVMCHGFVIRALTGELNVKNAQCVRYKLNSTK